MSYMTQKVIIISLSKCPSSRIVIHNDFGHSILFGFFTLNDASSIAVIMLVKQEKEGGSVLGIAEYKIPGGGERDQEKSKRGEGGE